MNLLCIFLLLTHIQVIFAKTYVISLGKDCQVAGYLRKYELRTEAYPFDWLQTPDFNGLYWLLRNDFAFFLDAKFLVWQGRWILNSLYKLNFVHDFPNITQNPQDNFFQESLIVENYLDFLAGVKKKYSRRIKRLRSLLKSQDKIIFMRSHMLPSEAIILARLFRRKYPGLNFTVVSLYDRYDGDIQLSDWNIEDVKAYFMQDPAEWHPHKWWGDEDWVRVFEDLNFINNESTCGEKSTMRSNP